MHTFLTTVVDTALFVHVLAMYITPVEPEYSGTGV